MKKSFSLLLLLAAAACTSPKNIPPVYQQENTGCSYAAPAMPELSELPEITALPDPLTFCDGRKVKRFSQWEERRSELLNQFQHYEVGEKPSTPRECISAELGRWQESDAIVVKITVGEDSLVMHCPVTYPEGDGPFPAVIGIGFGSGSLPADIFTSRGIAMIGFPFWEVMSHTQQRGNEPINKLYPELEYIGAYSAWPWGVSRLIDALEILGDESRIDTGHLAVTGCSFAGKMALFSGAFDERIALTIAQEPGGGGAASWRVSETLGWVEKLHATNYSWFIEEMRQFGNCVDRLPIDHHELCALVAPRALLVLGNPDYEWLADPSGYVSCQAARLVWEKFGISDRFGFSFADNHPHCMLPDSQRPEVEAFVDRFLLGKDVDTHVAKAPMYEDVDWSGWLVEGPEPADYVNPFIGASTNMKYGEGKTFPGATTPWGMVQVSPNTIDGGDNAPGYSCEHETIEGFAFTQMSGVGWYGDFGNFLVMPSTGPLYTLAGLEDGTVKGWRSRFNKANECAKAGYYRAELTDYGITAEATAARHSGMLRFTFPENETSRIQIDLARRVAGCSKIQYAKVVDDHTIEGWMQCPPECGGWGNGAGKADYTLHFHAEFSKPFTDFGFWSADIPEDWSRKREDVVSPKYLARVQKARILPGVREMEGKHLGFYTQFPTAANESVSVSVGISYVDIEGARKNFEAELKEKDFNLVRAEAKAQWNEALGKMKVSGGTMDDKTIFYTALYHTMIDPRLFSDVDGRYVGGDGAVHFTDGTFEKRTIFSGWDVFRSQMPLMTLIYPNIINDQVNSLVTLAEESGKETYERWEIVNAYSGCMVGNPALPVIADAYDKGIRSFDLEKAYRFAQNTSALGIDPALGYIPGSISETLEYGYADWCLGRFAEMLGKDEEAASYFEKAQAYRNIFDPEKGWFRPRNADGSWEEWPEDGRLDDSYGCVESNPYQQGWFVPHDVDGLVELLGGRETVVADLENFFEMTPTDFHWNDYYNHANEPVHWVPFLFNRLGVPHLTQKWTRAICKGAYSNNIKNGLCGNDDCGQMSAWYVLAASGIHPTCPGESSYELTSPVFDKIEMKLPSGKTFTVIAHENSPENIYIKEARLDGHILTGTQITYDDIMSGSTLELWMTDIR